VHPNSAFRNGDRDLHAQLIGEVGFGMVFLATPDGPRVAHTPLVLRDNGRIGFHLARGNALARHIDGANALIVVNGPDGYVSARWYTDPGQVPTWNYVALECEGAVTRLDRDGLIGLLGQLSAINEARVPGAPWTMDKMPPATLSRLLDAITGFELEPAVWRPTFKLSQNKPAGERARLVAGLDNAGAKAIAALMRTLGDAVP
jgi:transcriptional regulator